jgi:uncharacterized protein (DUF1800 family)
VDDRETIRPHALGRFRDLLWASAHSPAMLVYLDNQANRKSAPNENYARELLELHTLGVDGGYAQRDVMELARCLSGWTVKAHFWRGSFTFDEESHDPGVKTVLGMRLLPEGQREAERVLELLATHPSTAQLLATKLARRFISDKPPPPLVERAAAAFARTDGDIRTVLGTLLLDGLEGAGPKLKRPVGFVASALRLLNAETDGDAGVQDFLAHMGQPYFGWPTPDGYPDESEAWLGSLMPRWQFALELARGGIDGTRINLGEVARGLGANTPAKLADGLSRLLMGKPLRAGQRDELLAALRGAGVEEADLPAMVTAGLLASPAFQWQ